jgi:hypothetical protein
VDAIEQRVVALAEQLGRLVGTVQAKADGLIDRPALQDQLTRIRDGAAGLLGSLGGGAFGGGTASSPAPQGPRTARPKPKAKAAPRSAQGRSGGKVDAPGKKHRKPAARTRSVKHSDQMIPKVRAAAQMRRSRNKG